MRKTIKTFLVSINAAVLIALMPVAAMAEWRIVTYTGTNGQTRVAYTKNSDGYSLEIYRDNVGAVRSRFSLAGALDMFAKKSCPTYQVDDDLTGNRSINDAPCLTGLNWSEFVLGYVIENEIVSEKLNALVNGDILTYRFMLENKVYNETRFSLSGVKRAALEVIGNNVRITPDAN